MEMEMKKMGQNENDYDDGGGKREHLKETSHYHYWDCF